VELIIVKKIQWIQMAFVVEVFWELSVEITCPI